MANTLKLGAGKWATGTDTVLAFNDENNNFKPLPFSFSRASSATVVNQSGLIETVGSGEPRIDFLGNTKGALLLEPQRTNLITYSQDFSNSSWIKYSFGTGVTPVVTSNNAISPDGTLNASKVVFNTGSGTTSSDQSTFEKLVNTTSGVAINQSVYLKGENGGEKILIRGVGGSSYTTLTLTDKWVRYDVTETSAGTSSYYSIGLRQGLGGVVINSSVTIYMYAAQLEVGSYATSYIPTSGSAVTRVAEVCNQGGISHAINSTEGVLYVETHNVLSGSDNNIYLTDGTNSERVGILFSNSTGNLMFLIRVNEVYIASITVPANQINWEQTNKIAIKYKTNDMSFWLNGTKVGTDTSGNMFSPNTLSQLGFNSGSGGTFYGEARDVKLYNTALTDSELAALTTI